MSSGLGNVKCANVERGIWLVKVPKYLSEKWSKDKGKMEVGRLKILKPAVPQGKPEIVFQSTSRDIDLDGPSFMDSDDFDGPSGSNVRFHGPPFGRNIKNPPLGGIVPLGKPKATANLPKEHKFIVSSLNQQTLAILREEEPDTDALIAGASVAPKRSFEGRVIQRADCRPIANQHYMQMKANHIEEVSKPVRFIQQMDKAEVKFKPVARHADHVQMEREKKEGVRALRADRDQVKEILFTAFQSHQYYHIKDLGAITKQPYGYLREILNEICLYNTAPPHKSMWELKPEYRHYSTT